MRAPSIYYWRVRKNCFFALWSGALDLGAISTAKERILMPRLTVQKRPEINSQDSIANAEATQDSGEGVDIFGNDARMIMDVSVGESD